MNGVSPDLTLESEFCVEAGLLKCEVRKGRNDKLLPSKTSKTSKSLRCSKLALKKRSDRYATQNTKRRMLLR